jgi:protein-S-isoprenylcysteine O-methyltransferase Ste14
MQPQYKGLVLFIIWLVWFVPFALFMPRGKRNVSRTDRRAMWGVVLESVGFFLVYTHGPAAWAAPVEGWRLTLCLACAAVAWVFSWTSIRQLGPQWRIQAGLNVDHKLVTTGAYRVVRHPIYASMFWMLLAGIALVGTLPLWPAALALFHLGTEIRVAAEDKLLQDRFGAEFEDWKRRTPAYIPWTR